MRSLTPPAAAILVLLFAACGDDTSPSDTTPTEDVDDDTSADVGGDVDDTDTTPDPDLPEEVTPDVSDVQDEADLGGDDVEVSTPDVETDTGPDFFADWDYRTPWEPPTLEWPTCERTPDGTLAAKAEYYDWIVPALHQVQPGTPGHEDWSRVFQVLCDGDVPTTIVERDSLPTCVFTLSENNGLWTGLYVASQAFRYAATGDAEALEQVLRTLRGTHRMMRITGVPGLFTRDFRDPSLPQQFCPSDPMEYVPMGADMVGNRWVRIGDDGCALTWDPTLAEDTGGWVRDADHCVSVEYAGYCWQRNVSKDEYSGHMFAAALVAKLVDDEEAQRLAIEVLTESVGHLIHSNYWVDDYDGRQTRYGSANAMSLDHLPGFQAMVSLAWTGAAARVAGEGAIQDFYRGCLRREIPVERCIDQPFEVGQDYRTYLTDFALRVGCQTNYDNVGMMKLAYMVRMLFEPDPEQQAFYRTRFHNGSRGGPDGRDLWQDGNPHFNFTLVALMGEEPESEEDALQLVGDGVCALYEFLPNNVRRGVSNPDEDVVCVSERHGQVAAGPMPLASRCAGVYEWWGNPSQIENCAEELNVAPAPAGYLLPYWMGRYFGFISAEM